MNPERRLPVPLGDGLVMRAATADDAERLVQFNVDMHSDDPAEPDTALGDWTHDLLSDRHPTAEPGDYLVVVDDDADERIVSCTCLISQTWSYEDVPFGLGRLELVATLPDYRRRGLVRELFDVLHARSAAKGELVQGITGIPWYYRQFGYEMTLEHHGGRVYSWDRPGNLVEVEEETYRWRPPTEDDLPILEELYNINCSAAMVRRLKSRDEWKYHMSGARETSYYHHDYKVIEGPEGVPVGYLEHATWTKHLVVREFAVVPGHPWRPVLAFVARSTKEMATKLNKERDKPILSLIYHLGTGHPAYVALGDQLDKPVSPYTWYIRVADLPAFLTLITPVLERRLTQSVMAGHTGTLRLNLYSSQMTLEFEDGKLVRIGTYEPKAVADGDALFPDLTLLHLVFGHRSLEEVTSSRADCYIRHPEPKVLLSVLFPRRPSNPVELG